MPILDQIQVPTETPLFNEHKATEAGIKLIRASGGRQSLLKLLSMIFIADRRLIKEFGVGLTDDEYLGIQGIVAVPFALSNHAAKLTLFSSEWHQHIECHADSSAKVLADLDSAFLSDAENSIIASVGNEYGNLDDDVFIAAFISEAPEVEGMDGVHFGLREILISLGDPPQSAEEAYQDWLSLRRVRYSRNNT